MDVNFIVQHILTNIYWKNTFKNSLPHPEDELRHPCPLNPIQTPKETCLLSWENSDRCGIFWLGWLMDVGRYEGVAPSMWAFPAWFWQTSWSCAIYAQKGSLMLRKKMGGNQRSANFPLGFAPENGPHQVSSFLWQTQEKATFRGTWWGPFSRAKQSGKLPERRRLQKIGHFQGHRWRNSHSFAKIRLGMPT